MDEGGCGWCGLDGGKWGSGGFGKEREEVVGA